MPSILYSRGNKYDMRCKIVDALTTCRLKNRVAASLELEPNYTDDTVGIYCPKHKVRIRF